MDFTMEEIQTHYDCPLKMARGRTYSNEWEQYRDRNNSPNQFSVFSHLVYHVPKY